MQSTTEPKPEASVGAIPPVRDALANVRVLVIEDDHASAKLLGVVLGDDGCDVILAHSAEAALGVLDTWMPDAIVVDLVLPLMSGLLLTQQLRTRPQLAKVPIIAVSAFNGASAEQIAIAAGCTAYLRKPIDAIAFPQLLLSYLRGRS